MEMAPPKPIYKKWQFWFVVLIIAAAAAYSGSYILQVIQHTSGYAGVSSDPTQDDENY